MKLSFEQQNIIQWFKYPLYSDSKYIYMALKDYAIELKEGMMDFRYDGYRYFGFEVPYNKHNEKIIDLLETDIKSLDGEKITLTEGVQAYKEFKKCKGRKSKC